MRVSIKSIVLALVIVVALTSAAAAGQNQLSWTDNSGNESGFKVDRAVVANVAACVPAAPGFTTLTTTAPNIVTYTDLAVNEGVTYCYRIVTTNAAGDAPPSNVAARFVPFTVPNAASNLTVN